MALAISGTGAFSHSLTRSRSELHIPALPYGRFGRTSRIAPSRVTLRANLHIPCNQNSVATTNVSFTSVGSNQTSSQNPNKISKTPSTFNTILPAATLHHLPAMYKMMTVNNGNGGIGGGGGGGDGGGGGGRFSKSSLSGAANSDEDQSQEKALSAVDTPESVFIGAMSLIGSEVQVVLPILPFHAMAGGVQDQLQKSLETVPNPKAAGKLNFESLFSNLRFRDGGGLTYVMRQDSDEVDTEFSIICGPGGPLRWASFKPGGLVYFEQRNIEGLHTSINGSVSTSNLFNPQDDIAGKVEFVRAFSSSTFRVCSFNTRKALLTTGVGQIPPSMYVDRAGIKINNTKRLTSQTELMYGLTLEEIAPRQYLNGQRLVMDDITRTGGQHELLYAQANLTIDDTKLVNGALVGNKTVLQVDQGLGLCMKFPLFNRHQITMTRFIQLKEVEEGAGNPPPPVAVLYYHYGGCVGDIPMHKLFPLGGPNSVRGYNTGEIAFAKNFLELAAEIRVPVGKGVVYVFAEHGNDLGSSMGNPSEGQGSSYGVGAKLGIVRTEFVVGHSPRLAATFIRFGNRF